MTTHLLFFLKRSWIEKKTKKLSFCRKNWNWRGMVQLALTEWWKLLPREPRTPRLSLKTNRKFSISLCGHRYFSFWCSSIIFCGWKNTSSRLFVSFEKCSHPARVLADLNARHPRDVSNQVFFRARCEEKIKILISTFLNQTFHMCVSFITNLSSNLIGGMVLWQMLRMNISRISQVLSIW